MALAQFFLSNQVLAKEQDAQFVLRLSSEDAHHARVLRLHAGEHIAVIDATSDYFECEILSFDDELPLVRIARHEEAPASGPEVLLVQGLAKGDKIDQIIRQGTELGLAGFLPLICERSVVKLDPRKTAKRMERWRSIARSAAMQSGRWTIPDVSEPLSVEAASHAMSGATAVVICWEEARDGASLGSIIRDGLDECLHPRQDARIAVVVGPEGGLTEEEVSHFLAGNPRAGVATLGSTILRTETAGVVASALALYELGQLGNSRPNGGTDR